MQVEVDDRPDPLALERAVTGEGRRAARELFGEVLEVVNEQAKDTGGARQRRDVLVRLEGELSSIP